MTLSEISLSLNHIPESDMKIASGAMLQLSVQLAYYIGFPFQYINNIAATFVANLPSIDPQIVSIFQPSPNNMKATQHCAVSKYL